MAELADREEFVVEGCYLMRNRFIAREVWERLGFDVEECVEFTVRSPLCSRRSASSCSAGSCRGLLDVVVAQTETFSILLGREPLVKIGRLGILLFFQELL